MRVISKRALSDYWESNASAKGHLEEWLAVVRDVEWSNYSEVKSTFRSADMIGRRIVFNIGGNAFRLVCGVSFEAGALYVKFIGTHAEYDRVDVATVELK